MNPPVPVLAGSPGVTSQPEAGIARRDFADRAAKIFVVALFTMMAVNLGVDFAQTGRSTGLLLLASEALVVVLTICRRAPLAVDRSFRARALTTMSLVGPPLVQPATTLPLASEMFTAVFAAIGLLIVIGGKMSLGRSFGLMPANRGIVSTGLYSVVRHPIYLGYLITHVGFVLAHPTLWNLAVLGTSDLALLTRAVCEERTLEHAAEYRAYQERVRWRVVPGLF